MSWNKFCPPPNCFWLECFYHSNGNEARTEPNGPKNRKVLLRLIWVESVFYPFSFLSFTYFWKSEDFLCKNWSTWEVMKLKERGSESQERVNWTSVSPSREWMGLSMGILLWHLYTKHGFSIELRTAQKWGYRGVCVECKAQHLHMTTDSTSKKRKYFFKMNPHKHTGIKVMRQKNWSEF